MSSKGKIEILLIEEDSDYLESMLQCQGYDVTPIRKIEEAVGFLANNNYFNLVILDVEISNGSGWSVLREIKMNPYMSETPVIILTSEKDNNRMIMGSKDDGADDYIVKPFLLPNLIDKIETVLSRSKKSLSNLDSHSQEAENNLTQKEKDVLLLLNRGLSVKAISQKIGISEDIVKALIRAISLKLNVFDDDGLDFEISESKQLF